MTRKTLIRKPRKLLKVYTERTPEVEYHGKNVHSKIVIVTDKGTYEITSCSNCNALFWDKVEDVKDMSEKKKKIPAIEIVGETCAKPLPRKKKVFSSDGKSMWYEDVK